MPNNVPEDWNLLTLALIFIMPLLIHSYKINILSDKLC